MCLADTFTQYPHPSDDTICGTFVTIAVIPECSRAFRGTLGIGQRLADQEIINHERLSSRLVLNGWTAAAVQTIICRSLGFGLYGFLTKHVSSFIICPRKGNSKGKALALH